MAPPYSDHSRQWIGSTNTAFFVAVSDHPECVRRHAKTREYTSPFSITLSCKSRSNGAVAMGCQTCRLCNMALSCVNRQCHRRIQTEHIAALRFLKSCAVVEVFPTAFRAPVAARGSASTIAHTHLLHGPKSEIDLLLLRTDVPAGDVTNRNQAMHAPILHDRQVPQAVQVAEDMVKPGPRCDTSTYIPGGREWSGS